MQEATSTRNKSPDDASSSIGSLLRKADIAKRCNVSTRTVDSWLHSRKIPAIKIGRSVRFRWHAVEAALIRFERKEITRPSASAFPAI
jgi:excisionase family DNA binding protein